MLIFSDFLNGLAEYYSLDAGPASRFLLKIRTPSAEVLQGQEVKRMVKLQLLQIVPTWHLMGFAEDHLRLHFHNLIFFCPSELSRWVYQVHMCIFMSFYWQIFHSNNMEKAKSCPNVCWVSKSSFVSNKSLFLESTFLTRQFLTKVSYSAS